MYKNIKTIFIIIFTMIFMLTGCVNKNNIDENEIISNEQTNLEFPSVIVLEETAEKITEKINVDGIGDITYIHSTTSTKELLEKGNIAKGDILITDEFQYVFMKKFNGTEYADADFTGFSVRALEQKDNYSNMNDTLFNGLVVNADYCFANNNLITQPPHLSSHIQSANHCFENCKNLKFDDIAMFLHLIPNLSETQYMFAGCDKITTATMYQGNIMNTTGMFKNCINLVSFETVSDKVEIADNMFENCTNLTGNVFLGNGLKSYSDMFKNTQKEIVVNGNIIENITKEYTNVN